MVDCISKLSEVSGLVLASSCVRNYKVGTAQNVKPSFASYCGTVSADSLKQSMRSLYKNDVIYPITLAAIYVTVAKVIHKGNGGNDVVISLMNEAKVIFEKYGLTAICELVTRICLKVESKEDATIEWFNLSNVMEELAKEWLP